MRAYIAMFAPEHFNQPSANRRVKMKSLLLTILVFGLLSSSSFAQKKSPEQLREESSHIWGVEGEKQQLTGVVASGTNQRVGFFYAVNPDCSASGDVTVRVTKQPEHGTVETITATNLPTFPKENIRARCNNQKVRGVQVNYKSAEKYVGDDTLDLLVLFPGGFGREVHLNINVR
jgi:hypothetical protein